MAKRVKKNIKRAIAKKGSLFVIVLGIILFGSIQGTKATTSSVCSSPGNDVTISTSVTWDDTVTANLYGTGNTETSIQCHSITINSGGTLRIYPHSTSNLRRTLNLTGSLTINSGGTLILDARNRNTASSGYGMEVSVTGDVTVNSGGTISADNVGYTPTFGPGVGTVNYSGGGYGGRGGGPGGGATYGVSSDPADLGSGTLGAGGNGGGLIRITSSGTITNNGIITATSVSGTNEGGGSGGGIKLVSNIITGSGTVNADGGSNTGNGGGGGGRIALIYSGANSFSGTITAKGFSGTGGLGGAGTIFFAKTPTISPLVLSEKELTISNRSNIAGGFQTKIEAGSYKKINLKNKASVLIDTGVTVTLDKGTDLIANMSAVDATLENKGTINSASAKPTAINLQNAAIFYNPGLIDISTSSDPQFTMGGTNTYFENQNNVIQKLGNVKISNNAIMSHANNNSITCTRAGCTTTTDTNGTHYSQVSTLRISVSNIELASGGSIDVSYKGYNSYYGPGAPITYAGAGYGGYGQLGTFNAVGPGQPYGSASDPNDLGSGGGNASGANGGGLVKIFASGNAIINGNILSKGAPSTNANEGAGSGGTINVQADNIIGGGAILALGDPGAHQNSSAGGRVALIYKTSKNFYGPVLANGMTNAGAGTVFVAKTSVIPIVSAVPPAVSASLSNKELIIDNAGNPAFTIADGDLTLPTPIPVDTYKNITVKRKSNVNIPSGTVGISGGTFEINDSKIVNSGTVQTTGSTDALVVKAGTRFYNPGNLNINSASQTIFDGTNTYFENQNNLIQNIGNLYIQNSAILTHKPNSDINCVGSVASGANPTCVQVTDANPDIGTHYNQNYTLRIKGTNVVIDQGSQINTDFKGYTSNMGPGSGLSSVLAYGSALWTGGSYGGLGGLASNTALMYGSADDPNDLGSSGHQDGAGAHGGGLVRVDITGTFINNGTVTANGGVASNAGMASGGGIKIKAVNILNKGTVTAKGANASPYGAGGGGRIAFIFTGKVNTPTANSNVSGGVGGTPGAVGTLRYKDGSVSDYSTIGADKAGYLSVATMPLNDYIANKYWADEGQVSPDTKTIAMTVTAYKSDGTIDTSFSTNGGAANIYFLNDASLQYQFSGITCSGGSGVCTSGSYAVPSTAITVPKTRFVSGVASFSISVKDQRTSPSVGFKHHGLPTFRSTISAPVDASYITHPNNATLSGAIELEDGSPERALPSMSSISYGSGAPGQSVIELKGTAYASSTNLNNQDLGGVLVLRTSNPADTFSALSINRANIYKAGDTFVNGSYTYTVVCSRSLNYGDSFNCLDSGVTPGTTYGYGAYMIDNTYNFYTQNEDANYSTVTTKTQLAAITPPSKSQNFTATTTTPNQVDLSWTNPTNTSPLFLNSGHIKTIIVRRAGSLPTWTPIAGIDYVSGESVNPGETIVYASNAPAALVDGGIISTTDSTAVAGTTYYYEIYMQYDGLYYSSLVTTPAEPDHTNTVEIATPASPDSVAPVINITEPGSKLSNLPITVSFTVTDNVGGSGVKYSSISFATGVGKATTSNLVFTPASDTTSNTPISCTIKVTSSGDLTINATDNATPTPNPATATSTGYAIDNIIPTMNLTLSPTTANGQAGWYNTSVTVNANGADAGGSGLRYIYCQKKVNGGAWSVWSNSSQYPLGTTMTATFTYPVTDNGNIIVQCRSLDWAGNNSTWPNVSFKIDNVNPNPTTLLAISSPSNAGSTLAPLTIQWNVATDVNTYGSGMAGYKIFRKKSTDLTFTLIGVMTYPFNAGLSLQQTNLLDNTTYDYQIASVDIAGNASANSPTISVTIDRTGPVPPTVSSPQFVNRAIADANDIAIPANVTWSGANDVSGINHFDLFRTSATFPTIPTDPLAPGDIYQTPLTGSQPYTYTDTLLSNNNVYKYRVRGVDNVPNTGSLSGLPSAQSIVDENDPVTTATLPVTDPPLHSTWYNSSFSIDLLADDTIGTAVSQIKASGMHYKIGSGSYTACGGGGSTSNCSVAITNQEGNAGTPVTVYFYSEDNAGNIEAEQNITFKKDSTAPQMTSSSATYNGGTDDISLSLGLKDQDSTSAFDGSGLLLAGVKAKIYDSAHVQVGTEVTLTRTGGTDLNGTWTATPNFGAINGDHSIEYTFEDVAGNIGTFTAVLDADGTPPLITITNPATLVSGTFVTVNFTVKDNPTDAGSGVSFNSTTPNIFVSGVTTSNLTCTPANTTQINPALLTCSVRVMSSGTLTIQTTDIAGNPASISNGSYLIDTVPPVSTIGFRSNGTTDPYIDAIPNGVPNGNNGWYINDVDVKIDATDPAPGSGVANTTREITLNGGAPTVTTAAPPHTFLLSTNGQNVVRFKSTDVATNAETWKQRTIKIDKVNPSPGTMVTMPAISNAGTIPAAPLTISWSAGSDNINGSGVASYNVYRSTSPITSIGVPYRTEVTTPFIDETTLVNGNTYYYRVTTVDRAGRESIFSNEVFVAIDTSAPEPTVVACHPWNNTSTNILNWTAATGAVSYNVYKSDNSTTGKYPNAVLNPMPVAGSLPAAIPGGTILSSGVVATTYSDSGLTTNAVTHEYVVTGVDIVPNEGNTSNVCRTTIDFNPPVSAHTLSGTLGNLVGPIQWYKSPVNVDISNSNDYDSDLPPSTTLSGVKADGTYYSSSGVTYAPGESFTIPTEGVNKYYYKSEDNAGNMEGAKDTGDVYIDYTQPTGTISQASIDSSGATSTITVNISGQDATSLPDPSNFSAVVRDKNDNLVTTITSFAFLSGTTDNGVWQGTYDLGSLIIDSDAITYVVSGFISDVAGNTTNLDSVSSTLLSGANTAPQIQNLTAVQTLETDTVVISFEARDAEQANIDITNLVYVDNDSIACTMSTVSGAVSAVAPPNQTIGVTSSYQTFTVNWNAGADCAGKYSPGGAIQVDLDDLQSVNNTATATSAAFILDTANPGAPGNLTQSSITSSSITIALGAVATDVGDGIKEYKIFYKDALSGVSESDILVATIADAAYVPGATYTIDTLTANHTYTFNIWAYDKYGHKMNAVEVPITTLATGALSLTITNVPSATLVSNSGETTNISTTYGSINFGSMQWGETKTAALKFTGTTSDIVGYTIKISQNQLLTSLGGGGYTIKGFDANTGSSVLNASPTLWLTPIGRGYIGYTTTSNALSTGSPPGTIQSDRFFSLPLRKYAAIPIAPIEDEVSYFTSAGSADVFAIFKLELGSGQEIADYSNILTVTIVPNL